MVENNFFIFASLSEVSLEMLERIFLYGQIRQIFSYKTTESFFRNSLSSLRKVDFTEHYAKTLKTFSPFFAILAMNTVKLCSNRFKTMTNTMKIRNWCIEAPYKVVKRYLDDFYELFWKRTTTDESLHQPSTSFDFQQSRKMLHKILHMLSITEINLEEISRTKIDFSDLLKIA